jgi:hypothetical protein
MPSFHRYAPQEIQNLPFNSKRSQLYPMNPPTAMQAVEDALEGRTAAGYMPQKMAFTRYKNGPAAKNAGSSAVGAWNAGAIYQNKVHDLVSPIEAGKGIYTPAMANADLVRLPQAMDNWYANPHPIARGLLDRPIVSAAELNAYARNNQAPGSPDFYNRESLTAQTPMQSGLPAGVTPLGHAGRSAQRKARTNRVLNGLGDTGRKIGRAGSGVGALGDANSTLSLVYGAASIAGTGLGAYHGYKRNNSVGWAIGWGLLGGIFPVIVIPLAFAQGVGKRKR